MEVKQFALEILSAKYSDMQNIDLQLKIDQAYQSILNYCNIDEVPSELRFTLMNMAVDIIKQENGEMDLKSISEGDTSISFVDFAELARERHKSELNKFRRITW